MAVLDQQFISELRGAPSLVDTNRVREMARIHYEADAAHENESFLRRVADNERLEGDYN